MVFCIVSLSFCFPYTLSIPFGVEAFGGVLSRPALSCRAVLPHAFDLLAMYLLHILPLPIQLVEFIHRLHQFYHRGESQWMNARSEPSVSLEASTVPRQFQCSIKVSLETHHVNSILPPTLVRTEAWHASYLAPFSLLICLFDGSAHLRPSVRTGAVAMMQLCIGRGSGVKIITC